jgi:hypothetical protein
MAKVKVEKKGVTEGEAPVTEAAEVKPEKKAKTVTRVAVYSGHELVRIYSEADHGEDYETLAKQFATKKNYTLKLIED